MAATQDHSLDITALALRAELKVWEHDFATTHNGRKAGRADVKANREIAEKYKKYEKLRLGIAKPDASAPSSPSKKRKLEQDSSTISRGPNATPRKCVKTTSPEHPSMLDPYDAPFDQQHLSPSVQRTIVGPTPQRNGRVLGLFDLLSPASAKKTSSGARRGQLLAATPSRGGRAVDSTPSRPRVGPHLSQQNTPSNNRVSPPKFVLTPSRNALNKQATPCSTRISKAPALDETPEVLRRDSQRFDFPHLQRSERAADGTNDGERPDIFDDIDGLMNMSWSPVAARRPRPPLKRSLSSLAGGFTRVREENKSAPSAQRDQGTDDGEYQDGGVQVGDSQAGTSNLFGRDIVSTTDLPLGADGEREGDNSGEDDDELNRDGRSRRVWKKRGQKRQTRKGTLKPLRGHWKPEPTWVGEKESGDEAGEVVVPETQVQGAEEACKSEASELESEHGDEGDVFKPDEENQAKSNVKVRDKRLDKQTDKKLQEKGKQPTKPKKKVAATANANYRTLNIRNKNSKTKKGRFGGRRK